MSETSAHKASGVESGAESEVAAIWVPIDDLVPWPDNPRNNEAAVPKVAESIRRFGFANPIIARTSDRMVIAGHTRLLAARSLGFDRVPVRYMNLDPGDARLLAIVDNKSGEVAEWDDEGLSALLSEMTDIDLELLLETGFDEADLEILLEDPEAGLDAFDNITDAPPTHHTMNFTLSTDQKETVIQALDAMKDLGPFDEEENTNKNGNALARLAEMSLRGDA